MHSILVHTKPKNHTKDTQKKVNKNHTEFIGCTVIESPCAAQPKRINMLTALQPHERAVIAVLGDRSA